jgi:hypothetical protein
VRGGGLVLALALALMACGSDDCPTDDCELKGRTVVKWTFNAYPERGFPMDSCVDFGVSKVQVDVVDSTGFATTVRDDCGTAQATFSGLAPGEYKVYVNPLDAAGNPVIAFPVQGTVTAGTLDLPTEVTVNVGWDYWVGTFTGTFLFRVSWGGISCEMTSPEVKRTTLKLTVNGVVQTGQTDDGQKLDGTDMQPCKKLSENFPQSALDVAYGPATLLVEGYDEMNMMRFSKEFDTFVGAGITNPTLTFNVPTM